MNFIVPVQFIVCDFYTLDSVSDCEASAKVLNMLKETEPKGPVLIRDFSMDKCDL